MVLSNVDLETEDSEMRKITAEAAEDMDCFLQFLADAKEEGEDTSILCLEVVGELL